MKNKLLNIFIESKLEIKNMDILQEYIQHCLDNQCEYTKYETALHHILPKNEECFPEFINLNENKWNGTRLSHQNHYKAHFLLAQAIKNRSISFAWNMMKNKDEKLRDINVEKTSNKYHLLVKENKLLQSKYLQTITKNGKTIAQNRGIKAALTSTTTILKNGLDHCSRCRKKRVERRKANGNTNNGKMWINNGLDERYIYKVDIFDFGGYKFGRSPVSQSMRNKSGDSTRGTIWINYNGKNKRILKSLQIWYYIDGWSKGRLPWNYRGLTKS